MKQILFNKPSDKMHTIWEDLVNNPPKDYEYVLSKNKLTIGRMTSLKKYKVIHYLYKNIFQKIITPVEISNKFISIPHDIDLIFSPNLPIYQKFPWVVSLEEVYSLAGNNKYVWEKNKGKIEEILSSKYCKKIMPFTEFGKRTFEGKLNISGFEDKIEVVCIATYVPKIKAEKDSKFVNIIFVGTSNQIDPEIFNMKGGRETIEAFKILSKKYKNVKLKIISNIPKDIDTNIERLEILPLMDRKKVFQLYAESDIFLAPSYLGLGMAIVEALGSGLPLVCGDTLGLEEAIDKDNKNGLLINIKNKGRYKYGGISIQDFSCYTKYIYDNNKDNIVKEIVENVSILVEDNKLRVEMGVASREKYEKEFSIEARNKKLKRIFNESINR